MTGPAELWVAQGGPVIPDFGEGSDCVVDNRLFCPDWVRDNWSGVLQPALVQHVELTLIAVAVGFVISLAAALLTHRYRPLERPFGTFSAIVYTIPSLALFQLLVPVTGLTVTTVEVALVGYTLLILYRNILEGLRSVPPDVLEAAVVGVPDAALGEEVAALVVLRPGSSPDADGLQAWVKERVAAYKYPRRVLFVDELPKGPTGKILKREIDVGTITNR